MSGRAAAVGFQVRRDTVEVWHLDRMRAVFDRDYLRGWLANPFEPLGIDDVTLTFDRSVDRDGRVAITLPDVRAWTLSPVELANLRDRLGP